MTEKLISPAVTEDLQKGWAERVSLIFLIGTKLEEIRASRNKSGIPESKKRKSERIGGKGGDRNKSVRPHAADPKSGVPK